MGISGMMTTALSGMLAQQTRVSTIANTVANAETPGYRGQTAALLSSMPSGVAASAVTPGTASQTGQAGDVDLLDAMVNLTSAETSFAANASVFETGADLWDMLMRIKKDDT